MASLTRGLNGEYLATALIGAIATFGFVIAGWALPAAIAGLIAGFNLGCLVHRVYVDGER